MRHCMWKERKIVFMFLSRKVKFDGSLLRGDDFPFREIYVQLSLFFVV